MKKQLKKKLLTTAAELLESICREVEDSQEKDMLEQALGTIYFIKSELLK